MAGSTPEDHLTWYIFNYFGSFMTQAERLAYVTCLDEEKAKHRQTVLLGRTNASDPETQALKTKSFPAFMARTRDRIIRDHSGEVALNLCPKCGGLAMTPKAQQCRWCFHDWHPA